MDPVCPILVFVVIINFPRMKQNGMRVSLARAELHIWTHFSQTEVSKIRPCRKQISEHQKGQW